MERLNLIMRINLNTQPPFVSFSKNQINYKFSIPTEEEASVFPYILFDFGAALPAGEKIKFSFLNPDTGLEEVLTFVASATPVHNGTDFPDNTGFSTLDDYLDRVIPYLNANPTLSKYYKAENTYNAEIRLTARQAVSSLVIYNVFTGNPSGEPSFYNFDTYYASSLDAQKLAVNVYVEDEYGSNNYNKAASLLIPTGDSGRVDLNIEDIIHNELLQNEYNCLPTGEIVWKQQQSRKYYIEYGLEKEGETTNYTKTLPSLAILGGISLLDKSTHDPLTYLFAKKALLSWQPSGKHITETDKEYLSWFNYLNATVSARLQVVLYFNDSTTASYGLVPYNITLAPNEIATFDVSFEQLNIGVYETSTKKIIKWDLFVEIPATSHFSEIKTFYLDRTHHQYSRNILYINSFNLPEVIQTRGLWKQELVVNRELTSRVLAPNYTRLRGQEFQYNHIGANTYKVRTSFFTKKQAQAFQEVLLDAKLFEIEDQEYTPILLLDTKTAITQDDQQLHFFDLSVKKAFNTSRYSNLSKYPTFTPIIDCGLKGFSLDAKGYAIALFSGMTVYNEVGTSIATATYSAVTKEYILNNKITQQGNYRIEVALDVTFPSGTNTVPYYMNHQQNNESISMRFDGVPSPTFVVSGISSGDIYVDHLDGAGETKVSLTTSNSIINPTNDKIKISTPCASIFKNILITSSKLKSIQFANAKNLQEFRAFTNQLSGVVDLSMFHQLTSVSLNLNPDVTGLLLGAPQNLTAIDLDQSGVELSGADALLRDLWNKRTIFTNSAKTVVLTGNGIAFPAELQDLIDGTDVAGTGKYTGDGLVQKGFTVTV